METKKKITKKEIILDNLMLGIGLIIGISGAYYFNSKEHRFLFILIVVCLFILVIIGIYYNYVVYCRLRKKTKILTKKK